MVEIPTTEIGGETWILLNHISPSFTIRAVKIKHLGKARDPSDHRLDQAKAEGSVKCKPRQWDISSLKL